jgi:phosphoglycerate kinase
MSGLPKVTDREDFGGVRVLLRASLDVPIENGVVTNSFRLKKALPTVTYLTERGAKVILMTHVGRDPENTTEPIFNALKDEIDITYVSEVTGPQVEAAVAALVDGQVLLIGNLRSTKEEEENGEAFAKTLASYGDCYVDDAFAVAHRAHASIVGIPQHFPGASYAGITFADEYEHLTKALNPEHPALFIIGGAKFETKLPLISKYADSYEHVFVGGALANDLIKAKGYEVGESLLSPIDLKNDPVIKKENILTPSDVVAVSEMGTRTVSVDGVLPYEKILDVGQGSVEALAHQIQGAKTILWNGPLGNYEAGYDTATKECAMLVAKSGAFSIVGGGDTVAAIESLGIDAQFGFLSTAGGAMLEYLEKGTLPGIESLA